MTEPPRHGTVPAAPVPSATLDLLASHEAPLSIGDRNQNPEGMGLMALLAEDYRTNGRHLLEPGFVAIAVHRLGNARMSVRTRLLRAPLTLAYLLLFTAVNWLWGIDLPYTVRIGRRLRIWHHGGMVLGARAIGDDVHLRHNTTFGVLNRQQLTGKPIIGNRVDIGVGACVLGAVTVGDDSVIGPNSVVLRDVAPGAVVMGIPARQVNLSIRVHPPSVGQRAAVLWAVAVNPDCELPGDASPGQPASLRTTRIRIGQIEVDGYRLGAAVDAIEALVRSGHGGLVVTPNVDHVVIAERNVEFRDAYAGAALSLADGMPLLWAARILGTPLPEKVSGSTW